MEIQQKKLREYLRIQEMLLAFNCEGKDPCLNKLSEATNYDNALVSSHIYAMMRNGLVLQIKLKNKPPCYRWFQYI